MAQFQRNFREEDIPAITEKLFQTFDDDKNQRFTKSQFPKVMKSLTDLIGGEQPHIDDVEDLFNLLDVNGDETIDRNEFKSLIQTFFKILTEKKIDVRISRQSDICA